MPRHDRGPSADPIIGGIRTGKSLNRDENTRLARIVGAGGPDAAQAMDEMIRGNMRLVLALARKYPDGPVSLPDRVQEGAIGLMKAIRKYDPDRGFGFATYAVYWIRATIEKSLLRNAHAFAVPANVAVAIRRLRKAESKSPRPLTDGEVNDVLYLRRVQLQAAKLMPTGVVSADSPVSATDGDGTTIGDTISDESAVNPEHHAEIEALWRALDQCPDLTDRERAILERMAAGESYRDIGAVYGLSGERVRQVIVGASRKLRQFLDR